MTQLTICDVFDLPAEIPSCIVKIQDFDDPRILQENIRDYVITDTVAAEMRRLVDRIIASCDRQEAGGGHYVHGSFGSGKSHFMAILGLILENNPTVWTKQHPAIEAIEAERGSWLANNSILVVPVYMLGQTSLQMACYNAANARLERLGKPPCEFSDATKVIASFQTDAQRYGDVVYEQFADATGVTKRRFRRLAAGSQEELDELAHQILDYRQTGRSERAGLYPDKFSDGMATLSRHAQAQGFSGVVFLVDELILYLTGKSGREYADEFNDLVALADNSALDRAVPLWVVVAKQRNIRETVPDDRSQEEIFEAMDHHKDRFLETTELADTELVPIVEERVLKVRPGMADRLADGVDDALDDLPEQVRSTLMHELSLDDFHRVYPFHPALIQTLIDVTARLSRERAAIRLLYELLIKRHSDLPVGDLVPYASLFDVVFLPTGLTGDSANEELESVRKTYYERLAPLIQEIYPNADGEQARRARMLVKTILLAGLSRTMRDSVTVEQILHLNYQDLRGRTTIGTYEAIARILADLDNRSELVHFHPNPTNPALATASITLASGVQLADVLKRVQVHWRQRLDAYSGLMRDLLSKPITNNEIPGYEYKWRGSSRRGRVCFAEVAELSSSDLVVQPDHEFTLFIQYPFSLGEAPARADALRVIDRAQARLTDSIGFWLPAEFDADDLRDLEEYAKMLEVENNTAQYLQEYGRTQQDDILTKLIGQRRTKAATLRRRLTEVYVRHPAQVRFLDPAISPSLDVESLGAALDRIADSVCDRRYPHHPRFATPLDRRTLGRLLDEFLVPAALGDGSVRRTPDLDALLGRLGEPLELAERGASTWTLRRQSRYLSKLDELAQGRRIESDKIARGLTEAFGFNQELTDTFIFYLIKAQGFRALRNGQPVQVVEAGRLSGLVLERGRRLAIHEWANVKDLIDKTWVRPQSDELTVAAQDRLFNQVNAAARNAQEELDEARNLLVKALNAAEVDLDKAPRLAVLEAARSLNALALQSDRDAYDGLRSLLDWQPEQTGVNKDMVTRQMNQRNAMGQILGELQTDTLNRIKSLATSGNEGASQLFVEAQEFLAANNEEADLASHVFSWQADANAVIDAVLRGQSKKTTDAGNGNDDLVVIRDKRSIKQVRMKVADRDDILLDAGRFEEALGDALPDLAGLAEDDEVEATLHIHLVQSKD